MAGYAIANRSKLGFNLNYNKNVRLFTEFQTLQNVTGIEYKHNFSERLALKLYGESYLGHSSASIGNLKSSLRYRLSPRATLYTSLSRHYILSETTADVGIAYKHTNSVTSYFSLQNRITDFFIGVGIKIKGFRVNLIPIPILEFVPKKRREKLFLVFAGVLIAGALAASYFLNYSLDKEVDIQEEEDNSLVQIQSIIKEKAAKNREEEESKNGLVIVHAVVGSFEDVTSSLESGEVTLSDNSSKIKDFTDLFMYWVSDSKLILKPGKKSFLGEEEEETKSHFIGIK